MNFDMTFMSNLALPLVVAACLILGYIMKQWVKDVDNKYIPTILAAAGVILACLVKRSSTLFLRKRGFGRHRRGPEFDGWKAVDAHHTVSGVEKHHKVKGAVLPPPTFIIPYTWVYIHLNILFCLAT